MGYLILRRVSYPAPGLELVCVRVMAAVTLPAKGFKVAERVWLAAFADWLKVMHDQVALPMTCVACVAVALQHDAPNLAPVRGCVDTT